MSKLFQFKGTIPGSKSILNRCLILKSYFPDLNINGFSLCDDVVHMKKALESLTANQEIFCGEAGTTFRFMALRASRIPGQWKLTGSPRLFERPQGELLSSLHQLGVLAHIENNTLIIETNGWRMPNGALKIQRERSSQFASAVLLNAWELPFELELDLSGPSVSDSYWQMTLDLVRQVGMTFSEDEHHVVIPQNQKVTITEITVEPDYSSAFAVAAAAAICGEVEISGFNTHSLQPDYIFVRLMKEMGADLQIENDILKINQTEKLLPIEMNLENCPDLFPVLGVLCSFANGISRLSGAPHLVHKESNRIAKTWELLQFAGVDCDMKEDGLVIHGKGRKLKPTSFAFNPDHDHRMAMAAGLLIRAGFDIKLESPQVVSKSFPEFWSTIGVNL